MNKPALLFLVDDDPDDEELFKEAIKEISPSLTCISARDGKEALDLLSAPEFKIPDIIFLDLNMPRINGKQCLIEIKKRDGLSRIPVVIYSTTRRAEDEIEFKKLGAVRYLVKPSSFQGICMAIKSALTDLLPQSS